MRGPDREESAAAATGGGGKTLRRRAVVAAAIAVLLAVAGWALWPTSPRPAIKRAAEPAAAAPEPPPSVAEPPRPKKRHHHRKRRVERRPKPANKPKRRRLRVRIDARAANPVAVAIPAAGISAPVIALGLRPDGRLEVPRRFSQAGWRTAGPEPGERGAAMITAHVDSRSGPAAFYDLRRVSPGDEIRVARRDGSTVTFVARRTEQVRKSRFPSGRVYGKTRLPTLRLVTCGGSFDRSIGHYRDNLIVYATRKPS